MAIEDVSQAARSKSKPKSEPKSKSTAKRLSPAEELARIPLYEKGKPPQPLFDIDYMDELEATWGRKWGAQTELGRLRSVMVQPITRGPVESPVVLEDPIYFGWPKGLPDMAAMLRNHESLVNLMKAEGVEVIYLNAPEFARGVYTVLYGYDGPREVVVANGGALIGRPAVAAKRGIERILAQRLMEIGCPILYTMHGKGSAFEGGGNLIWLDETHVMLGASIRTSMEGIEEISPILNSVGVEEIHVAHLPGYLNHWTERAGGPGGFYHLDMVFNMAAEGVALIYPAGVGYDTVRYLKKKGLDLIEVPYEEMQNYACNVLALRPGRLIVTAGNPRTREQLEKRGIETVEMSFEGGKVSGRGPACSTLPLIRDKGPSI